jgi:hypothetical protein
MNAQKILAVFLIGMFFLVATTSIGSTASADRVKVGCKDLAFVLITWDQLLPLVPEDDIAENEHQLNENGVEPDTYQDIIDRHINDLLNDINKCDLNDALEQMVEDIDPELP